MLLSVPVAAAFITAKALALHTAHAQPAPAAPTPSPETAKRVRSAATPASLRLYLERAPLLTRPVRRNPGSPGNRLREQRRLSRPRRPRDDRDFTWPVDPSAAPAGRGDIAL